jgi:hypothetical protein
MLFCGATRANSTTETCRDIYTVKINCKATTVTTGYPVMFDTTITNVSLF